MNRDETPASQITSPGRHSGSASAFDLDGLAFDLQAHIGPSGQIGVDRQIEERPHNTVG
ncbi:hypothetical protein [Streptomyces anulatus]|uniref:hypothetical protein n=1 Tax=Streptomyces anulatus TaxID=1892 RepID=UPI00344AB3FA